MNWKVLSIAAMSAAFVSCGTTTDQSVSSRATTQASEFCYGVLPAPIPPECYPVTFVKNASFYYTGTAPAPFAWRYQVGFLESGTTKAALRDGYVNAHNSQGLSNADYATFLYGRYLQRAPDAGGYAFWLQQLNSGAWNRSSVRDAFLNSQEAKNLISNTAFVDALVYTFELSFIDRAQQVARLNAGLSRSALRDEFFNQPRDPSYDTGARGFDFDGRY
jgi:hypothetical protein